jgi:hypothetical protein
VSGCGSSMVRRKWRGDGDGDEDDDVGLDPTGRAQGAHGWLKGSAPELEVKWATLNEDDEAKTRSRVMVQQGGHSRGDSRTSWLPCHCRCWLAKADWVGLTS